MNTPLRFLGTLLVAGALVFSSVNSRAAQNVSAHYAHGQVEPRSVKNQIPISQFITRHWPGCAPGTEVIFVTLTDGGYTWPDRNDNLGWDANAEVPRCFLQHVRP